MAYRKPKSKKPSAGKQPLSFPFTFFIDENHCRNKALLAGLDGANLKYELHCTHFAAGTSDVEWLPIYWNQGVDRSHQTTAFDGAPWKRGVLKNKVRLLVFTDNNTVGSLMAERIISAISDLRRLLEKHPPPVMASITKLGNVVLLWPIIKKEKLR